MNIDSVVPVYEKAVFITEWTYPKKTKGDPFEN